MKKTLIALAAVAVSGAAFAQVTLTGTFSVSVQKSAGDTNPTITQTDAAFTASASEDLGGGLTLSASQGFEMAGRVADSVAATDFGIALAGGFGKVEYKNFNAASALLGSPASLGSSFNDALGGDSTLSYAKYTAPTIVEGLGLTVASYEKASNALNADKLLGTEISTAWGASYAQGPASGAVEYVSMTKRTRWQLAYDAGFAKATYRFETNSGSATVAKQSNLVVTAPVGALTLGMFVGKRGAVKGNEYSASYALSKRTAASVSFGDVSGATAVTNGNSYRFKLSHSF
jgi:hypothetical protein